MNNSTVKLGVALAAGFKTVTVTFLLIYFVPFSKTSYRYFHCLIFCI